jgi:hypothetical protein
MGDCVAAGRAANAASPVIWQAGQPVKCLNIDVNYAAPSAKVRCGGLAPALPDPA